MHIAMIITVTDQDKQIKFFKVGGAEKQIVKVLKEFQNKEITISFIAKSTQFKSSKKNIRVYAIKNLGLRYARIPPLFILKSFFTLLHINRSEKIDVLNPHLFGISVFSAILARFFIKAPIILKTSQSVQDLIEINSRNSNPIISYLSKIYNLIFFRYSIKRIDYFQALNKAIKNELIQNYNVNPNKIFVIPNGVSYDPTKYRPDFLKIRTIGYVGRLSPEKNLKVLLDAFLMISNEHDDAKLRIFGVGSDYERINAFIGENHLEHKILLEGFVNNIFDIYSSFDVFVLPSKGEGISNSLLEAMSYGIPVIASNVIGNYDVIKNNVNGLLFPFNSSQELFEKMKILMQDVTFANKLRAKAYEDIKNKYGISSITSHLFRIYQNIMKK